MRRISAWVVQTKHGQYAWRPDSQVGDPLRFAFFRTRKDASAFAESKGLNSSDVAKVLIRIEEQ